MAHPVIWLILTILDIYFWVILITVIMSWLIGFNVINGSNPYVRQISYALHRVTEPLLGPIRRMLPDLGGIDISPIILLLALQFLRYLIIYYAAPLLVSGPLTRNLLAVRVTPKASRNEVTGLYTAADGAVSLSVKVTAAPDKGQANAAVIKALAKAMMVSKSTFHLVKGQTDRNKTFEITGPLHALEAFIASLTDTGHPDGKDH